MSPISARGISALFCTHVSGGGRGLHGEAGVLWVIEESEGYRGDQQHTIYINTTPRE